MKSLQEVCYSGKITILMLNTHKSNQSFRKSHFILIKTNQTGRIRAKVMALTVHVLYMAIILAFCVIFLNKILVSCPGSEIWSLQVCLQMRPLKTPSNSYF